MNTRSVKLPIPAAGKALLIGLSVAQSLGGKGRSEASDTPCATDAGDHIFRNSVELGRANYSAAGGTETSSSRITINLPVDWNSELADRFDQLSERFALGSISDHEEHELQSLLQVRRRFVAPRSYEEIKREFEIEQSVSETIAALRRLIKCASPRFQTAPAPLAKGDDAV